MNPFDYSFFQRLNGFAGASAIADAIIIFCATYLIFFLVGGTLVMVWRTRHYERVLRVLHILGSMALGEALVFGSHFLYNRPRPFDMFDLPNQLLYHSAGNAFPSGHATVAFAIATAVFLWNRTWGSVLYAAALVVGISRIIGGVHWPTDILAGALVGAWSAWMIYAILWRKR